MGKNVKTSQLVKLATTPSACELVYQKCGGAAVLADRSTELTELMRGGMEPVAQRMRHEFEFLQGKNDFRGIDTLSYDELGWLAATLHTWQVLCAKDKEIAEKFIRGALRGASVGRARAIQQNGQYIGDLEIEASRFEEDLEHQQKRVEMECGWVNGVLGWHMRGRHTYTVTPTLSEMLAKTSIARYPISEIKLPFSHIELVIPVTPGSALCDLRSYGPEIKAVSFLLAEGTGDDIIQVSELVLYPDNVTCASKFPIIRQEDATVSSTTAETIRSLQAKGGEKPKNYDAVIKHLMPYLTAITIYISTPDADNILCQDSTEYQRWVKDLKRKKKMNKKDAKKLQISGEGNRHILGNSIKIIDRHDYSADDDDDDVTKMAGAPRKRPVTHWRQGHMKSVRCGPRNGPQTLEPRWIKPTIVAPPAPGVLPAPKKTVVR